jgi:hypothetical protein
MPQGGAVSRMLTTTVCLLAILSPVKVEARFPRSAGNADDSQLVLNSVEHIWGTTTVAVGDTAVLHCSFDALFQQLPHGNIDWLKETPSPMTSDSDSANDVVVPTVIATGRTTMIDDRRYRVYRPHNSALSVLIIRRAAKQDAGVFRCNLAGSSTRQKYLVLNVTDSKIEAQTSPIRNRVKVDGELTLWCNATGYPLPVVYWTREDRTRRLPDGSFQYWGNGLHIKATSENETGVYVCSLDNFVQPVVSYKFTVFVEDSPWRLDAYKMRYDSKHWFPSSVPLPTPVDGKSFLLMCETRGSIKPPPVINWYLDGKPVAAGKHFYIIRDSTEWRKRFLSSTLVIMRYSDDFKGKYSCVASNGFRIQRQVFRLRDSKYLPSVTVEPDPARGAKARPTKPSHDNTIDSSNTIQTRATGSVPSRLNSIPKVPSHRNTANDVVDVTGN